MKRRTPNTGKSTPGQRQLRVGERIRHILSEVLMRGDIHEPFLEKSSMITVTSVDIGPDLQHANAYVMPLGGKNVKEIVEALNKISGYFRTEVSKKLDLRYAPKISFRVDHSFEQVDHIERLLRQDAVQRDLNKPDTDEDE